MKPVIDTTKLVERFNNDEATWRRYEHKRELRRLLSSQSPLPDALLDYVEWLEAERECDRTWCVGRPIR